MAVERDHPYGNARFIVDLGLGDPQSARHGFRVVAFPVFDAATSATPGRIVKGAPPVAASAGVERLVLSRGATGSLDLYAWWNAVRSGKPPKGRTATVDLLGEEGKPVMRWTFRNVRPVTLTWSPLDAMDGGVLMETVELAFDSMEVT